MLHFWQLRIAQLSLLDQLSGLLVQTMQTNCLKNTEYLLLV